MSILSRTNLFGMSLAKMEMLMAEMGEKPFRAKQLFQWVYQKEVYDFAGMSSFNKPLRDKLQAGCEVVLPEVVKEQRDPDDGTRKFLVKLHDGNLIEMVLIPVHGRLALCMSSQVGCTIGCKFCATGLLGFKRNLTTGEMLGQLVLARQLAGEIGVANIVLMGMGEPLLNLQNVIHMIETASSELGISISARKFTISTVGLVKQLRELTKYKLKAGLALSLHAPTQQLRERLVPSAKDNPLDQLIPACRDYIAQAGDRVTLEYIMIAGITDTMECAKALADLTRKLPCKVNLIAYNPIIDEQGTPLAPIKEVKPKVGHSRAGGNPEGGKAGKLKPFTPQDFKAPTMEAIDRFREYLYPRCPAVTFRKAKGLKIAAACGQLVAQIQQP
jgi:23S rRNA (adenine2503-C2)-methyltransferase